MTHGILSSNALEKITNSTLSQLVVTNTLPQEEHLENCPKLKMLDISHVLAETIRRSHYGESVSYLFDAMLWDPIRVDCECALFSFLGIVAAIPPSSFTIVSRRQTASGSRARCP